MSDCDFCRIEKSCYYPYKPCSCVDQRKFRSEEDQAEIVADIEQRLKEAKNDLFRS